MNESTKTLFSMGIGPVIFRITISRNRFEFSTNCLRFHDESTRRERLDSDRFAVIRRIHDEFMGNCSTRYTPSTNITIDETIIPFRGNCPFRVYSPQKPGKYGMELFSMVDSSTKYLLKAVPYLGRNQNLNVNLVPREELEMNKPANRILRHWLPRLIENYHPIN